MPWRSAMAPRGAGSRRHLREARPDRLQRHHAPGWRRLQTLRQIAGADGKAEPAAAGRTATDISTIPVAGLPVVEAGDSSVELARDPGLKSRRRLVPEADVRRRVP